MCSQAVSKKTAWPLKMWRIVCPEMSVKALYQRFVTSQRSEDLALRRKPEINILLLALRPNPALASSFLKLLDHTRHTTVLKTSLDVWSGRRRDLYLVTHITRKRKTSLPPAVIELTVSVGERPQTHASDRVVTVQLGLPILFSYCNWLVNMFQAIARTLLIKWIKK
jgi:hypothetical protein